MHKLLFIILVFASSAVAQSATVEITFLTPEEVRIGKDELERFNTTTKHLSPHPDPNSQYQVIQEKCEGQLLDDCIAYLLQHRQAALSGLPDNPAYWEAFHSLIESNPIGIEPNLIGEFDNPRDYWGGMFEAMYGWVHRDLARSKNVDVEKFANYYNNLRRLSAESETLMERMIFVAGITIAHTQMPKLIALYSAREDRKSIQVLRTIAKPFSTMERSLRKTLMGEARYAEAYIENAQEISAEDFPNSDLVPLGTLEELKAWLKNESKANAGKAILQVGTISERSWSNYWRLPAEVETESKSWFSPPSAYLAYVSTVRSSEVHVYLIQALADVHLGLAPPGIPQRPAPPFWDWSWDEKDSLICLSPNNFVVGKGDFSQERPACVHYIDPAQVREYL